MASSHNIKDLQWLQQVISSESINLKSISFSCSQQTSSCYQETDDSINANISKDSISHFTDVLSDLGASKNLQSTLTNLEFNHVEWGLEQVLYLGILVQNSSSIKRLVFQRNRFSTDCIAELCDILKRNKLIKELVLCESGIGSSGAGLIAASLKINSSLEELQIWEDSIGSRGAEEISKMIEMNSTLKLLIIFDSNSITATPLISAVLARNRAMEVHIWRGENEKKNSKLVEFSPESSTLRIYRLDVSGACRVACSLGMNTTVKSLDMTGVRLKSRCAKEFRWVLEQNRTLKEVKLSKTCLKDKGVVYVAAGLFKNRSLHTLYLDGNWFGGIGVEHLLCPLSRFSSLQMQANITLKSVTFGGVRTKIGRDGLAAIIQMLTTNETLIKFGIYDDVSLSPEDMAKIFRSLEKNASLKYLSLQGCKGVQGELVLKTITETLKVNPWIEDIDLQRTPLQNSGKADVICQRLCKNEKTEPEVDADLLADMPLTEPKTCRVFLCGQDYAGKSTLCSSISQNFSTSKVPYIGHVRTLVNPIEQAVRRNGMTIKTFRDEDTKISIWNIGGQHESFSLHDLMFPGHGSPCLFLIVSSLFRKPNNREAKTVQEIEQDLHYWLRFIVSNSRRTHRRSVLPNVTIVLTHHDKINQHSQNLHLMVNAIEGIRDKFQDFVDLYPTVFTIDGRSSASVSKLIHHLRKESKTILQKVPRVYQMCNDLAQILSDWRMENHNKPVMKWKEFAELCQVKVPPLRIRSRYVNKEMVELRRKAVASCLHHIGEVIYFEESGFLILDCEWFCSQVLGELVKLDVRKQSSMENNGFISQKRLEKILRESMQSSQIPGLSSKIFENLDSSDLVRMMLKLELCYEQDPSDPNSLLLIPSALEEGRRKQQRWQLNSAECIYAGRHLECDDSGHMFLTPGFFPRLQVHLHNKIVVLKNQHGATYNLEKYLISININGIHVRVELGGQLGYYIDVLACSTKSLTETLRLIQQLIIPAIQSLCQGITLRESIIRPECVENLIPPRYRKSQHVPVAQLKQALLSVPADNMYDYQHTWDAVTDSGKLVLRLGFDLARDLLSDDDFREVLHRRYHDLYNLAAELDVPPEPNPDDTNQQTNEHNRIDPSFAGIAKGVEQVLQRLKIIEQEIRDLKQEIQGLRYYEHRLLIELHRKVNYLVNYNIQVEERKVPNMFYFVRTENYSRRLVTSIISGMNALRLHMLCEFRREMHVVEDQIGCEVMQVDNMAVKCLAPHMKSFMKLITFALKIGAHLAVGMGELIPDLSREVARLTGTSLLGAAGAAAAAGAVGAVAMGQTRAGAENSRNVQQDVRAAQQWVVDFLRERRCSSGNNIAEKFGLWRVRYRDDGQIAWICRRHISMRANEIIEAPI